MNIEKIFSLSAAKLKNSLRNEMVKLGYAEGSLHNKKDFLYAEGNAPYMLVAHLDTVHKQAPSIICYSKDGKYMMSPQGIGGDDRCGVYIILTLLEKLPFKPYVVFTMGEEIGGIGASAFIDYMCLHDIPNLKYIVEYDRKGDKDCVFYSCDNPDFTEFVEQFGFKEAYGTFSDISIIAPEFGVAAVNLSSGYYNPHTEHEYVSFDDMNDIINKSLKMFAADCEQFVYIEGVKNYGKYSYSSYADKEISVSFVPENTMFILDYYDGKWGHNGKNQLAVDASGNLYKYNAYYGDYSQTTTVYPIDDDFIPTYDPNNVATVYVFGLR